MSLRRKEMADSGHVYLHGIIPKLQEYTSQITTHQWSLMSHYAPYYLSGLSTIGTPIL